MYSIVFCTVKTNISIRMPFFHGIPSWKICDFYVVICVLRSADGRWKENDNEIYEKTGDKNSSINESLRRVYRVFVLDLAALHFFPFSDQYTIYVPVSGHSDIVRKTIPFTTKWFFRFTNIKFSAHKKCGTITYCSVNMELWRISELFKCASCNRWSYNKDDRSTSCSSRLCI